MGTLLESSDREEGGPGEEVPATGMWETCDAGPTWLWSASPGNGWQAAILSLGLSHVPKITPKGLR